MKVVYIVKFTPGNSWGYSSVAAMFAAHGTKLGVSQSTVYRRLRECPPRIIATPSCSITTLVVRSIGDVRRGGASGSASDDLHPF